MTLLLAPDRKEVENLLADTATTWLRLNGFTNALLNADIGELSPNPPWLLDAHKALGANRQVGFQWFQDAAEIRTSVVVPFIRYNAAFQAFVQITQINDEPKCVAQLIADLERLCASIRANIRTIEQGSSAMSLVVHQFASVHGQMQQAATEAVAANASNQVKILKSAAAIAQLEQEIINLGGEIRSGAFSSGEAIVENEIDLIYSIAAGAAEIPFVGIGLLIVTVVTDLIEDIVHSEEISRLMAELDEAMKEEFTEVQAAIALQGATSAFSRLNDLYLQAQGFTPHISLIWEAELDKLEALIEGLKSGADPALMPSFQKLPEAVTDWEALTKFATSLLSAVPSKQKSLTLPINARATEN